MIFLHSFLSYILKKFKFSKAQSFQKAIYLKNFLILLKVKYGNIFVSRTNYNILK